MKLNVVLPGRFGFALVLLSILLIAQRAPAPIVEPTATETPTTEERAPRTKHSPKSKPSPEKSETTETKQPRGEVAKSSPPARSRFAGNWVGTMPTIPWGNLPSVVTIDSSETAMAMSWYDADDPGIGKIHQRFKPSPASERNHAAGNPAYAQARINGDTITASFPAPVLGTSTWSLTPQPDGVTANVRMQAFMNNFTAVFRRSQASSGKSAR